MTTEMKKGCYKNCVVANCTATTILTFFLLNVEKHYVSKDEKKNMWGKARFDLTQKYKLYIFVKIISITKYWILSTYVSSSKNFLK